MKAAVLKKENSEKSIIGMSDNEMFARKVMRAVIVFYPDEFEPILDWLEEVCVLVFGKKEV